MTSDLQEKILPRTGFRPELEGAEVTIIRLPEPVQVNYDLPFEECLQPDNFTEMSAGIRENEPPFFNKGNGVVKLRVGLVFCEYSVADCEVSRLLKFAINGRPADTREFLATIRTPFIQKFQKGYEPKSPLRILASNAYRQIDNGNREYLFYTGYGEEMRELDLHEDESGDREFGETLWAPAVGHLFVCD